MKKIMFSLFAILLINAFGWSQIRTSTTPMPPAPDTFIDQASIPFGMANEPALLTSISDFELYDRANGIQITWNSLEESTNAAFEVQRSRNGDVWRTLQRIPGQNKSYRANTDYQYFDQHPHQGKNYYRLRKINNDGTSAYSEVKSEHYLATAHNYDFSVYPNPATRSSEVFVKMQTVEEPVIVDLFDMNGKLINQYFLSKYKTSITLSDLPKGYYVLSTQQEDQRLTKKLVVR